MQPILRETELLEITIARLERIAAAEGRTPGMICREDVQDNRLYPQMRERLQALRSGRGLKNTHSLTMGRHDRLHDALDAREAKLSSAAA
jgi:hypothetical protein